jgi:hypothetical protein
MREEIIDTRIALSYKINELIDRRVELEILDIIKILLLISIIDTTLYNSDYINLRDIPLKEVKRTNL